MAANLTIGKLAQASEVNVETIRYYHRKGLLGLPSKPQGGQRTYSDEHVKRVRFIRRAQALGFTLAEIATLLAPDAGVLCSDTRNLVLLKITMIDRKIAELTARRRVLDDLVRQCGAELAGSDCPVIEELASER